MRLFSADRTFMYPAIWSILGGAVALFFSFLILQTLQLQFGVAISMAMLIVFMGAGTLIGMIWTAVVTVGKSRTVLKQLKMRVKGSYGIDLTDAELETLLPFKARFGWGPGTESYGTITREVFGGTERRMLTRKGDIFHLDKVFALELTNEVLEAELVV